MSDKEDIKIELSQNFIDECLVKGVGVDDVVSSIGKSIENHFDKYVWMKPKDKGDGYRQNVFSFKFDNIIKKLESTLEQLEYEEQVKHVQELMYRVERSECERKKREEKIKKTKRDH